MELSLHQADENGFINLSGLVQPFSHFTVSVSPANGLIRLNPVKVTTTAVTKIGDGFYPVTPGQQAPAVEPDDDEEDDDEGDAPFPA